MSDRTEQITAYLDGAMSGTELEAFEAELDQDTDLADEVARYLANDDLLREAFDQPMQEPVDAAMLVRMGLGEPNPARLPNAANDNPPFWRRWRVPLGGAIAASLALVLMLQAGPTRTEDAEFAAALESTPSASTVKLSGGGSVTPQLTFKSGDGRYCREFVIDGRDGNETGIACREDSGWKVETRIKGGGKLQGSGEIGLAAGEDASKLDEAYARLNGSDPIPAEDERALIAGNWAGR